MNLQHDSKNIQNTALQLDSEFTTHRKLFPMTSTSFLPPKCIIQQNNNNFQQTSLDRYNQISCDFKNQLKQNINQCLNNSKNLETHIKPNCNVGLNSHDKLSQSQTQQQQSCQKNYHFNNNSDSVLILDKAAMDLLRLSTEPEITAYNNKKKQIFSPNKVECLAKSASTTAVSRNLQTKVNIFF